MRPVPAKVGCLRKYPWWDMLVGDDILYECEPTYLVQCRIGRSLNRLKAEHGLKFTQRVERAPVPGIRVWRLA